MNFEDFSTAWTVFLTAAFILAFLLGFIVHKTNFCTMGAVSDWVNMGDKGRLFAWVFATATAILGVTLLEAFGLLQLNTTFPPYRASTLIIGENILGGILFGIGMTLAGGCANKNLVRLGGGNLKSLVVLFIISIVAYFMINPFPGSDHSLFSLFFYDWIRIPSIDLASQQDIGAIISSENTKISRLIAGLLFSALLGFISLRYQHFRQNKDNLFAGLSVGILVILAWYLSGSIMVSNDEGSFSLVQYLNEWDMLQDSDAGKPFETRSLATQSFTFVNPASYLLGFSANGFAYEYLTFGVLAFVGVIFGSLAYALISKSFRIEWFNSLTDVMNHVIGAILMAVGAVLAVGCTIGQAVSGVSTLALGSFITAGSIIFASALTMKIQYYQMVYEDEANFFSALLASLADMRLIPNSWRKLEQV